MNKSLSHTHRSESLAKGGAQEAKIAGKIEETGCYKKQMNKSLSHTHHSESLAKGGGSGSEDYREDKRNGILKSR